MRKITKESIEAFLNFKAFKKDNTEVLRGGTVEGHKIYDHSQHSEESEQILEDYKADKLTLKQAEEKANKVGARFANWRIEDNKYMSLHMESGLDRLNILGYKVIQAI